MEATARPDAQQYLVQLLEQAPIGVVRLDEDGCIASANPAAARLLDVSERDLNGRSLATLFEDEVTIAGAVTETTKTGEGTSLTTKRGPSESVTYVEINLQRFDTSDMGRGVLAILQDATKLINVQRQREEILTQLEFLVEASSRLGSSLDLDELFAQISDIVVPMLADWCALDVMESDGQVQRIGVKHKDPKKAEFAESLQAFMPDAANRQHPVVRAIVKEKPVIVSDMSEADLAESAYTHEHLQILLGLGVRSVMVVPLMARGRMRGTLTFVSSTNPKRYGATQLLLALDIATRAAMAMDNALLLSEHRLLARKLQESLLPPSIPKVPGVDLAARYHAASPGIEVGGDFYDFFATGSKNWDIVIGDVSGKGADAAGVTTLARYTIRAAAMKARTPRRILAMVNDALYEQTPHERFATVAFMRVRTDGGPGAKRVTLASAGHPLPLILNADGSVEEVGEPGSALGLMVKVDIKDHTFTLQPGAALVLFTDGAIEARTGDHMLGIHGLRTALAGCKGLDADAIAEQLAKTTLDFQKEGQHDDLAIVVLRVPDIEA